MKKAALLLTALLALSACQKKAETTTTPDSTDTATTPATGDTATTPTTTSCSKSAVPWRSTNARSLPSGCAAVG